MIERSGFRLIYGISRLLEQQKLYRCGEAFRNLVRNLGTTPKISCPEEYVSAVLGAPVLSGRINKNIS
jgi:hypothetical protein